MKSRKTYQAKKYMLNSGLWLKQNIARVQCFILDFLKRQSAFYGPSK